MSLKDQILVHEKDVYVLTDKGQKELGGSETSLSPRTLELLVSVDGKATVAQIGARLRPHQAGSIVLEFKKLILDGLVELGSSKKSSSTDYADFYIDAPPPAFSTKALAAAEMDASNGLASLQKHGYFVRIARRAAAARKPGAGKKLSVVVIEDDLHLAKFLKQYLVLEGLDARIASNRAEVIAEFQRPPLPDLVLLDVVLPDADGFDILIRMRQHPVLKSVPVMMLTAKATREAVLKGLAGGADGYITKPFEADGLIKAIKSVLGLAPH